MSGAGPLDGLDEIDWSAYRHAYGTAEDVPDLVRRVASSEPEVVEDALDTLTFNVVHQGTRYTVSGVAAPFLCALAGEERTLRRVELLDYLSYLAVGYCESWTRDGFDAAGHRARQARWTDNQFGVDMVGAYDAVCASIDPILVLVDDDDPALRRAAVYLLAGLGSLADRTLPLLARALAAETQFDPVDDSNVANVLLAVGLLAQGVDGGQRWLETIQPFLDPSQAVIVRFAAAVSVTRLADPPDPEAIAVLLDAIEQPPDNPGLQWQDGDLGGLAAVVLERSVHDLTPEMTDRLLGALRRTQYLSALTLVIVLLQAHFWLPEGPPELAAGPTHDQRRVLECFVDAVQWEFANLTLTLRDFGLPMRKDSLGRYLGGAPLTECRPPV